MLLNNTGLIFNKFRGDVRANRFEITPKLQSKVLLGNYHLLAVKCTDLQNEVQPSITKKRDLKGRFSFFTHAKDRHRPITAKRWALKSDDQRQAPLVISVFDPASISLSLIEPSYCAIMYKIPSVSAVVTLGTHERCTHAVTLLSMKGYRV